MPINKDWSPTVERKKLGNSRSKLQGIYMPFVLATMEYVEQQKCTVSNELQTYLRV